MFHPLDSFRPSLTVVVEYTARGERTTKTFTGPKAMIASRSFYLAKTREGAEPKVIPAPSPATK